MNGIDGRHFFSRFGILLLICAGVLFCPRLTAQSRPVLVISIDGLRPDAVLEAERHGLKLPNLRRFLAEGSFASGVRGAMPTVTYPSHATLITGVSPRRHGIESNESFDPLGRNLDGWNWYAEDIRVETLWSAAHRAGYLVANIGWPVSVGAEIDFNLPQYWRAGSEDDDKLLRAVATPGLPALLKTRTGRLYPEGWTELDGGDSARTGYALALMALKRPTLTTVYLGGLDHAEHMHGLFSPEANSAIEHIDGLVGQLRAAAGAEAVVVVVSDHGFANVSQSVNLRTRFREAGLIEVDGSGNPTDWQAAPWNVGSVAYIRLAPNSTEKTRQKTESLLKGLLADPASGVFRVLDRQQIEALGGSARAEFAVVLKSGYCLGEALTGPLVTPAPVRGMHGFPPDDPEMNATFLIAGPGIPAGKALGMIDMRDVAPTVAAILGVAMPEAEGHNRLNSAH